MVVFTAQCAVSGRFPQPLPQVACSCAAFTATGSLSTQAHAGTNRCFCCMSGMLRTSACAADHGAAPADTRHLIKNGAPGAAASGQGLAGPDPGLTADASAGQPVAATHRLLQAPGQVPARAASQRAACPAVFALRAPDWFRGPCCVCMHHRRSGTVQDCFLAYGGVWVTQLSLCRARLPRALHAVRLQVSATCARE